MSDTERQTEESGDFDGTLGRRAFVGLAMAGVGVCYAAAIGYPVYRYLASPAEKAMAESAVTEISLANADTLAPGNVLMFKFGSTPTMLIHHKDGSWVALTAVCTHLGCTAQYQPDRDVIHCNCHGGEYDAHTGGNISGPPPKPLKRYNVKVSAGSVLVSRM
ncbi:MAG: ubiquinol-cytochrome c reductase iron-sulfur subunit [Tepidisphaeraceae bacterium]|jgi:cytochrome b6-f complex iron-sulfur subunit